MVRIFHKTPKVGLYSFERRLMPVAGSQLPRMVSGWSGSCSRASSVNDVVVFLVSNTVNGLSVVVAVSATFSQHIHHETWIINNHDQLVCLFVCLSVCLWSHIPQKPNFTQLSVHVTGGRGSVLLSGQWDMLRTSGFVDDVTFPYNGRYRPESKTNQRRMFRPVRQMAAPWGKVCRLRLHLGVTDIRSDHKFILYTSEQQAVAQDNIVH